MTRNRLLASVAAVVIWFVPTPSSAQIAVFDPSNYSQNLMTAANTLRQIENQITALQNQTQMLLNQARQLASLPTSLVNDIDRTFTQTQNLLRQADRIAYDVQAIEQTFQRYQNFSGSQSDRQLIDSARDRWETSVSAFQHAMSVGATAVNNLPATQSQTGALVTASQSAIGVLQASQAGNQLLGVQARQLADPTALLAAQGRAQSIEQARQAASEDQARELTGKLVYVQYTKSNVDYVTPMCVEEVNAGAKTVKFRWVPADTTEWTTVNTLKVVPSGGSSTSGVTVHSTLIYGQDAFGIVKLGGAGAPNIQIIIKPVGSSGSDDPVNQRGTIAWKVKHFCAAILQDDFIVRLEHAVSA